MICPARKELHLIGTYPTDSGRRRYRLYGRSDCTGCDMKARCTDAKGRRLKVLLESDGPCAVAPQDDASRREELRNSVADSADAKTDDRRGPRASITEPEALMMLATSVKRWEPSYNADITVTRHGVIVSQFLTKRPTDFHHFEPALAAVSATLKPPQNWVGDGHYGTQANVVAAARAGIVLYAGSTRPVANSDAEPAIDAAPPTESTTTKLPQFRSTDFRLDTERDILLCPAGEELHLVGEYSTENELQRYRLYGRSNCAGCPLKDRCTSAKGRRIKLPVDGSSLTGRTGAPAAAAEVASILRAHEARMKDDAGTSYMRLRGQTVEPVNGQLKQHGLGRLHVHGLARSGVVLALACIAHNVMKWRAREAAQELATRSAAA